MSKPRFRWWGFARAMIRDYPGLKDAMAELHRQTVTASNSGMPKGGGAGRTVESIALRQLPRDDQQVYDAVSKAIKLTEIRPDGHERLELIRLMYWAKNTVPAKTAAPMLNISEPTAWRWHGAFVYLVGHCYGFETEKR